MGAQFIFRVLIGLGVLQLVGCGTYVPAMEEFWDQRTPELTAGGVLEFKIRQQVYCDIVEAVISARNAGYLPKGWAVQVTLDLQVDETGSLNPGATFLSPLRGTDTFSVGLGASLVPKVRGKISSAPIGISISSQMQSTLLAKDRTSKEVHSFWRAI